MSWISVTAITILFALALAYGLSEWLSRRVSDTRDEDIGTS